MSSAAQSIVTNSGVLGPSTTRNGLYFYNDTNVGNCYVAFGVTASLQQFTFRIAPSGSQTCAPGPTYCGPVSAVWDSAGAGSLRVTETS
jgi:hypothetical protein